MRFHIKELGSEEDLSKPLRGSSHCGEQGTQHDPPSRRKRVLKMVAADVRRRIGAADGRNVRLLTSAATSPRSFETCSKRMSTEVRWSPHVGGYRSAVCNCHLIQNFRERIDSLHQGKMQHITSRNLEIVMNRGRSDLTVQDDQRKPREAHLVANSSGCGIGSSTRSNSKSRRRRICCTKDFTGRRMRRRRMSPLTVVSTSISSPAESFFRSRTAFGMSTWPLVESFVVTAEAFAFFVKMSIGAGSLHFNPQCLAMCVIDYEWVNGARTASSA